MIMRLLFSFLFAAGASGQSPIKGDELVLFFPTLGHRVVGGESWELEVHGWIFESEPRTAFLGLVRRALGIEKEELTAEETALFKERARWFLTDNERNKKIKVEIAGQTFALTNSGANGHFAGRLKIAAKPGAALETERISFRAITRESDERVFAGEAVLLGAEGLSVISDIDDTIKVTNVRDRHELLRNTFCRPYRSVPGMVDVYRAWATNHGAQFHYVTAGPWQLFAPTEEFTRTNGFPAGTFHMKLFRWKDETVMNLFESPHLYKRAVIAPLLERYPARRFVLVGDSGEKDPEAYGDLARKHPKQVARIFIRDVTGEAPDDKRYRKAFDKLPAELWKIFREPSEIRNELARAVLAP